MSPVLSVLVTVTALVSLVSPVRAVTCYSCGPQVTPGCELSHLNNKLQEEDLARVQENGTCSLPHHAEYCSDTDWCVKTWRGNTSDPGQMTGDTTHVTQARWQVTLLRGMRGTWAAIWTVSPPRSHLQTDGTSYCETRAFRFWDWTVALSRLILSHASEHEHSQLWVNESIVTSNIPIGQTVNIKCPMCVKSMMIKALLTFLMFFTSIVALICLSLIFTFSSHRVGLSDSRKQKCQRERLYHGDKVNILWQNICLSFWANIF